METQKETLSGNGNSKKNLIWEMKMRQNLIWETQTSDFLSIFHGEMESGALIISLGKWKENR